MTKALSQTILIAVAMAALVAPAPRVRAQAAHADSLTAPGAAPVDTVVSAPVGSGMTSIPADDLAEVVMLEERRRAAMVAADTHTLRQIIAEDATYVHSTGLMQNRDELLRLLENKTIRYLKFDVEKTSYRVYGSTFVGTGVQRVQVMSGGKTLTIHSRYTVVYTLREGAEVLIAYQSTPLPEMTPAKK